MKSARTIVPSSFVRLLAASAIVSASFVGPMVTPARAISADLAKKCRQMMFNAYPPKRVGTKTGTATATEGRKFYLACLANGGSASDDKAQSPPSAAPR